MSDEIWILGATGRSGRDVAERLDRAGAALVLCGRSGERLDGLASRLQGKHRTLVGTLDELVSAVSAGSPGVVVNTVGPFAETSRRVASACPPGTHYIDLANEFSAVDDILGLQAQAVAKNQVLVTGGGYGVLGTESVVLRLCAGRSRRTSVRCDAIAALALDEGLLGAALAGSIVEVIAFGGREVRDGKLVRSATGSHFAKFMTPDGDAVSTGGGASGELLSAWRASDADAVVAASTAVPSNAFVRTVAVPIIGALVKVPGVARLLASRIAKIRFTATPMSRRHTWAHARAEWPDGSAREGWLRLGDAGEFTSGVLAEVALRLLRGEGTPGAYTPGALFGFELVEQLGGELTVTEELSAHNA